jgi:hypothetical protein
VKKFDYEECRYCFHARNMLRMCFVYATYTCGRAESMASISTKVARGIASVSVGSGRIAL